MGASLAKIERGEQGGNYVLPFWFLCMPEAGDPIDLERLYYSCLTVVAIGIEFLVVMLFSLKNSPVEYSRSFSYFRLDLWLLKTAFDLIFSITSLANLVWFDRWFRARIGIERFFITETGSRNSNLFFRLLKSFE